MIRNLRILMVTVLVGLGVVVPANAASAGPLDATCAGTQTVTYTPGVVLLPAVVSTHFNNIWASCVSASVPALTSGTSTGTVSSTESCLSLAAPGSGQTTIAWNTGQSSVLTFTRTVTTVGGSQVVTLTGVISSGLFAGDSAIATMTGPAIDLLDCLQPPGVTSRSGIIALTITST